MWQIFFDEKCWAKKNDSLQTCSNTCTAITIQLPGKSEKFKCQWNQSWNQNTSSAFIEVA